jgi:osmoprotectant transport system permease protein
VTHALVLAGGPVIPNYGTAKGCVADSNSFFCTTWIREHWHDTIAPAIVQHLWLTAIAVGLGFAIAFAAALIAHRFGWFAAPFGVFSAFLYTIPSIALFQLLVPVTGITVTTIEIGLVGYTLLILFRNTLAGLRSAPPEVLEAARGMGLTRGQILRRVELPLALPAISAGIRISVVTTISLATIAAYITPYGLGKPIFDGLQINYATEYVVAGLLAISLALVADASLVVVQRALTPWYRARRVTA